MDYIACQASLSWRLLKFVSTELVMLTIASSATPFSTCPQPLPASGLCPRVGSRYWVAGTGQQRHIYEVNRTARIPAVVAWKSDRRTPVKGVSGAWDWAVAPGEGTQCIVQ